MAPGSASLNVILVYLYIFPLPLHIGRLHKGGCCWLCERCREFQEMLQTFLIRFSSAGYLSTFCLWFWQFHWLRFFAQTSAVCTVKKHHILYVMIGFEARCFTAKSGRFVPIAFIPTEVTVHWRTYMSTWAKGRGYGWHMGDWLVPEMF